MGEIKVRIHRTIFAQSKVFVSRWEVLQKVHRYQLVELRKSRVEERVLVARDNYRCPEIAADIVVRHSAKQHDGLDEQQKGVGVFRRVINEKVLLGHILWIERDVPLWQPTIKFRRQTYIPRLINTPGTRNPPP